MAAVASDDDEPATLTAIPRPAIKLCRVQIRVASGPDSGKLHTVAGVARIGTREIADLVLTDPKVSSLHCELHAGERTRLRDLGSKNGTFLGSHQVIEALVGKNDTITIGDTRLQVLGELDGEEVPLHSPADYFGLVGYSPPMRALVARLARLGVSDATVLIQGETGTGKEVVAEVLHASGQRARGPLVIVDCGALPETLTESELFGHERGAFTGADKRTLGAFERAQKGTIFLDEIGELPLSLQPKLLRAIESRTIRRLGGDSQIPVDVRVVAATNRDLAIEVARGRFREDLYHRLAVVTLTVPPLRERREDVPLLAAALLRELGIDPTEWLTKEALDTLGRHEWSGNVRELRNTLQRAVALMEPFEPLATPQVARPAPHQPAVGVDLSVPLRVAKQRLVVEFERAYVQALMAACQGNVSEAARRAGMDRMSIHRILQRHKLRDS